MKKTRSALSAMLAAALLLTGCGAPAAGSTTSSETSSGSTASADSQYLCSEEPITFTFFDIFDNITFDPSWAVFQEAAKLTNVSLESSVSQSSSDETTAFNLMLSSGNLADIISYVNMSDLEKLGHDGGLIPLNDLIDEYAPHLKQVLEENDEFRKIATAEDGNIYVIPKLQSIDVAEGDFIRMDWLEKLNLEVPNTVDELYTVLKAFREQDPNGNGLKDEIPFFSRQGTKSFNDVLNLWDAHEDFYVRDGKITYGPMEDEFKLAMENAVKWYAEGLIDPEWFTRGSNARDVLLGANQGGYCNDWFSSNAEYNDKLAEAIPGFSFLPIAPVENQNGERIAHTSRVGNPGWGISAQCEDPVAAIKYFDFWFTDVGNDLCNYGVEGVTYTRNEDGSIQYTDAIMNTDKTALSELRNYGVQYRIGMIQDYAYEEAWSNDIAKEGNKMYEEGGYVYTPIPQLNGELALKYTTEEDSEYTKIMSSVTPYVTEMIQKWVLGSEDFASTYDAFIQSLKDKGIERAIEINQAAYDRYMAN
ncbi:extracellular solute-binding protein [uncultured Subdoligranulum sp.]|uniref:extracellular solute-binding protein n=1 Tax=uncultured Subdoligranulum sp. TaxID=512298 RepID=UPI00260F79FD|nr:extracellular solute-binding protein [uncultured Subdoligranulum sp.]